jgi:hypothetical protein
MESQWPMSNMSSHCPVNSSKPQQAAVQIVLGHGRATVQGGDAVADPVIPRLQHSQRRFLHSYFTKSTGDQHGIVQIPSHT